MLLLVLKGDGLIQRPRFHLVPRGSYDYGSLVVTDGAYRTIRVGQVRCHHLTFWINWVSSELPTISILTQQTDMTMLQTSHPWTDVHWSSWMQVRRWPRIEQTFALFEAWKRRVVC